jgi:nitrous oxidase accessory protein
MSYLTGSYQASERRWIVVAALVLLPVFFLPVLPIWTMKLWAPQYPEGLTLTIYVNTIRGDLQNINTLNHYVGMHRITPDDFKEFTYMPQMLTFFGVMALLAALVNRRWLAILGWIGFTVFAAVMFGHYANWLYHYGHDLDPRAAIKLEAFTPPVIGYAKMANFKVWSLPGAGSILLGLAWLLGPVVFFLEHRAARSASRGASAAAALLAVLWSAATVPLEARAATVLVPSGGGAARAALEAAGAGDTLLLAPGVHAGPLRVDRPLTLRGEPGAVLDGSGKGTVLTVAADRVAVEDLSIRGSGNRVITIDSGVRVISGRGVVARRLRVSDVLYGVYAERADSLRVEACDLTGRVTPLDETGNGNGIHLWNCAGAVLEGNRVTRFQDGVYLSFANQAHAIGNTFADCGRYGLHTMYCQENVLARNRFTRNVAGCAIMFSNGLRVLENDFVQNRGPRTYGLLLRDCSAGEFTGNRLVDNTIAVFMDNSNRNRLRGNLFQDNGWGLLLFSSCAGNEAAGNNFWNNDYPVALDMRHSDNRFDDGRTGNFWSDNAPYDLDANGVSDVPYSPVSAFAFLSKQNPDLSLLAKSPAVAAVTVAERVFPALRPSEIVDRYPLVAPPSAVGPASPRAAGASPAWPALAFFTALGSAGVVGIVKGRAS